MIKRILQISSCLSLILVCASSLQAQNKDTSRPNVIIIYADDLGYGDISINNGKVPTPNIDQLAKDGLLFTNGHSTSATCTPSRYSILSGEYAWRKPGTGIARGNAGLILDTAKNTIADLFHKAGYTNAAFGKWHLGLGPQEGPDWNAEIKPGPLELGFDYSFILPATGDRVPCVYLENHRIVNLDPNDPITVSYDAPIPGEPTGEKNPELLRVQSSHGHNNAIVNGIGRIGHMKGGKSALWIDEDIASVLSSKASAFIEKNKNNPFFIYFATHDIHVPRTPHAQFLGKSGLGLRGDVILQLDWTVGQIKNTLDSLGLTENTLIVFSSDNGPVLDDGYVDQAVEKLGDHTPAGVHRGTKYSLYEGGTRVPLILSWPAGIQSGIKTEALVSQLDLFSSFAHLLGQPLSREDAPDSQNFLATFLGKDSKGRTELVEHAGVLAIIVGDWKYIEPSLEENNGIHGDLGRSKEAQLYNLKTDLGEKNNIAKDNPERVKELSTRLKEIKDQSNNRL